MRSGDPRKAQGAGNPREAEGAGDPREAEGAGDPREAQGAGDPREAQGTGDPRKAQGAWRLGAQNAERWANTKGRVSLLNIFSWALLLLGRQGGGPISGSCSFPPICTSDPVTQNSRGLSGSAPRRGSCGLVVLHGNTHSEI